MSMLPGVPGAYTFAEVVGSIVHPLAGTQVIGGQLGIGSIMFEMNSDKLDQSKPTADGYVVTNYMLGLPGKVTIECLQGSQVDNYLLGLANDVDAALSSGQADVAISGVIRVRDLSTGNSHTAVGCGVSKQPGRSYASAAQMRTWVIFASELANA